MNRTSGDLGARNVQDCAAQLESARRGLGRTAAARDSCPILQTTARALAKGE